MIRKKIKRSLIHIYIFVSLSICFTGYFIVNSPLFLKKPAVLSFGITFDITLSIPILYLLLARIVNIPKLYIIPIFILTLILANFILPYEHHQFLNSIKKVIFLIEPVIVFFVISKILKVVKEFKKLKKENFYNIISILHESLGKIIGQKRILAILVTEISLMYFGLFAWKNDEVINKNVFYSHKRSWYGSIIGVFAFLSFVETVLFHLVLMHLNVVVSWIILLLNFYGILFLFADFNATKRQPHCISDKNVIINVGVRWRSVIPLRDIRSVKLTRDGYRGEKNVLRALTLMGHPNAVIVLKKKQMAVGIYGVKKYFDKVAINLDDPKVFKKILQRKIQQQRM